MLLSLYFGNSDGFSFVVDDVNSSLKISKFLPTLNFQGIKTDNLKISIRDQFCALSFGYESIVFTKVGCSGEKVCLDDSIDRVFFTDEKIIFVCEMSVQIIDIQTKSLLFKFEHYEIVMGANLNFEDNFLYITDYYAREFSIDLDDYSIRKT